MKIIGKLFSLFKKDCMVEELYKIGAYHEAGHAVLGFYSGFEVKSISLIIADPGSGITRFDYGIDNLLIT
jgi:ATP-dependent Zn protease